MTSLPDPVSPLPPTGHDSTAYPGPSSYGRLDQDARSHRNEVRGLFVLAFVLGAVDAILIKTVWNVILADNELISWAMAIITAFGATLLAWTAGRWCAIGLIDHHRGHLVGAALAAIVWIVIGAAVSWLRWQTGALTSTTINVEGATTTSTAQTLHHILAIALIALYLMPGITAALHGYETGNPIAARQRATHTQLQRLRAEVRHLEARAHEQDHLLTQHYNTKAGIDTEAALAKQQANALAEELKAYARVRIAEAIGEPTAVPSAPAQARPTPDTNDATPADIPSGHDDPDDKTGASIHAA